MSATISKNPVIPGYPGQQIRQTRNTFSGLESRADQQTRETDDVRISREAQALRQVYDKKERTLEETYANERGQLEREYLREKKQLEQEFRQKRQSLGVNIYA